MEMDDKSLERISPERMQRVFSGIMKISAAFNVALGKETQVIYANELIHLSDSELENGVTSTIREWEHASKMPPLNFILERSIASEIPTGRRFASVSDIDPERCPKGWTPEEVFAAHLTQEKARNGARRPMPDEGGELPTIDSLGKRLGVTTEQVQKWLEGGKAAQREKIARLEADPAWRAMAERLGAFKGLSTKLPKTEVPADPAERSKWAKAQATKSGWTKREPGCDDE